MDHFIWIRIRFSGSSSSSLFESHGAMARVGNEMLYGRMTVPTGSVTLPRCLGGKGEVVPLRCHVDPVLL